MEVSNCGVTDSFGLSKDHKNGLLTVFKLIASAINVPIVDTPSVETDKGETVFIVSRRMNGFFRLSDLTDNPTIIADEISSRCKRTEIRFLKSIAANIVDRNGEMCLMFVVRGGW